jgi:hypothetical protein
MTGTTLLSQREQAESQLRAAMFGDLIGPIVGHSDNGEIPLEREQLLVELLALNFHEHFEFKPLLEHVESRRRLAPGSDGVEAREALRSIARRVKDRQIASLFAEGKLAGRPAEIWTLYLSPTQRDSIDRDQQRVYGRFGSVLPDLASPQDDHTVLINVTHPDWKEDTARVTLLVVEGRKKVEGTANFVITTWDFPLTDNTRLNDGNRFALIVANSKEDTDQGRFKLKLIWFPKGYSTAHERPLNFWDLQKLMGKART